MKILIITDAWHPQLNGVVRTYEHLIKELTRQGHEVKVISPNDFKHRFQMPGYREIDLVYHGYKTFGQITSKYQPDTIHISTEGPLGWMTRKHCQKNNIKFTTSYHTQFPDYIVSRIPNWFAFVKQPIKNLAVSLIRKFHNSSSAVLVTTNSIKKELEGWNITAPILPFTRGVDTAIFNLSAVDKTSTLKRPISLYVGRLAVEKNIEAFLDMPWTGSKLIVGDGPDFHKLKSAYPDAHFVGKKSGQDLATCYKQADIFVFPSKTDTFGMVLIEALACGLPIAAYPIMGPQDIVTEDYLGALDNDLSIAAKRALTIAKNTAPENRHNHVVQNYTWEMATAQFLEAQQTTLNDA